MHRIDAGFVSYNRWPKNRPAPTSDPWPVVPELAIEVISPNDVAESVQERVKVFLEAGVRLVWLVYPQQARVIAYQSLQNLRGYTIADDLDADPVLPEFRLPMRDLFSGPAAPQANGEHATHDTATASVWGLSRTCCRALSRLITCRNASALASMMSVLTARPVIFRPLYSASMWASPWASSPTVTLCTR